MLHPQHGIRGLPKPMNELNVIFLDGIKQDICTFVVECDVCQRNKGETVKALGTLQPYPIPPAIWRDISMDFIVGLPKPDNNSVIMVVVDRLSKYAHFFFSSTPIHIHNGSDFHGSYFQDSWHASFYCI
jgi:hypothetical protein